MPEYFVFNFKVTTALIELAEIIGELKKATVVGLSVGLIGGIHRLSRTARNLHSQFTGNYFGGLLAGMVSASVHFFKEKMGIQIFTPAKAAEKPLTQTLGGRTRRALLENGSEEVKLCCACYDNVIVEFGYAAIDVCCNRQC